MALLFKSTGVRGEPVQPMGILQIEWVKMAPAAEETIVNNLKAQPTAYLSIMGEGRRRWSLFFIAWHSNDHFLLSYVLAAKYLMKLLCAEQNGSLLPNMA